MTVAVTFETGVFKPYRFTSDVHLGAIAQNVPAGTIVQYDGSVMQWGGQTYTIPQLQAGIRIGWLVPAEDTTSVYRPQPAGVRVRPAQSAGSDRGEPMQMEEASEEEQIVGTVAGVQERREDAQKAGATRIQRPVQAPPAPQPAAPVAEYEDAPHPPEDMTDTTPVPKEASASVTVSSPVPVEVEYVTPPPPPAPTPTLTTKVGRTMEVITEDAVNQDAEPVARVFSPAKQKTIVTDSSAAAQAVSRLDNSPPPKPQKLAKAQAPSQDIRVPGPHGATGDVSEAKSGDDLTDLLPDAATVPLPPGTPNIQWDRNQHWRSRVQQAIEVYGDDPGALRQILAQESPNVAKHIRAELARNGKTVE